jgi:hypothetical protein
VLVPVRLIEPSRRGWPSELIAPLQTRQSGEDSACVASGLRVANHSLESTLDELGQMYELRCASSTTWFEPWLPRLAVRLSTVRGVCDAAFVVLHTSDLDAHANGGSFVTDERNRCWTVTIRDERPGNRHRNAWIAVTIMNAVVSQARHMLRLNRYCVRGAAYLFAVAVHRRRPRFAVAARRDT